MSSSRSSAPGGPAPANLRRWIGAAVLAGFALRLLFVLRFPEFVTGDSMWYRDFAQVYARDGLFGENLAKFDRPPVYPFFLGWFARFWGDAVLIPAGAVQCVISAAGIWCLGDFLRSVFPRLPWLAVGAVWVYALDPWSIDNTKHLGTETLGTPLFLAFLASAARALPAMSWRAAGVTALLGALGVLTRIDMLPTIGGTLAVAAWLAYRRFGAPRGTWLRWTACGLGVVLLCLPWSVHASIRRGQAMFVSSPTVTPVVTANRGWFRWCGTILVPRRQWLGIVWWESHGVDPARIPDAAFDSPGEKASVLALIGRAHEARHPVPEVETELERIAYERVARRPLRQYVAYPLARSAYIWLDPFDSDRPDAIAHTRRSGLGRVHDAAIFAWVLIGAAGFLASWVCLLRPSQPEFLLGWVVLGRTYSILLAGPLGAGGNAFFERRYVTCVEPLAQALAVWAVLTVAGRVRRRNGAPAEASSPAPNVLDPSA